MWCDNSLKLIERFVTEEWFYIISELCYLNLDYLNIRKKGLLIEEIKELLMDLNKGLKVMYNKKYIEILSSNILLSLNKNNVNKVFFKISDFSISKSSIRVISQFISPECLKGKKILIKVIYDL